MFPYVLTAETKYLKLLWVEEKKFALIPSNSLVKLFFCIENISK